MVHVFRRYPRLTLFAVGCFMFPTTLGLLKLKSQMHHGEFGNYLSKLPPFMVSIFNFLNPWALNWAAHSCFIAGLVLIGASVWPRRRDPAD